MFDQEGGRAMKRIALAVLPLAFIFILLLPGAALASGNTSEVEQKWIDFQKAVTDQMVKDGMMTRQEADTRVKEFQTRFAQSADDSIYKFFADKNRPGSGNCKDGKCNKGRTDRDGAAMRVYSMLTGKSVDDVQKACASGNLTVWQLAKNEGKLDALKSKLLSTQTASLDVLVKGGIMTDQQRTSIVDKIKDELSRK
jgi:polyhydroxyalkanoate synthesis regulator phasin